MPNLRGSPRRGSHRQGLGAAAAALSLLLPVAACGGDDDDTTEAGDGSPSSEDAAELLGPENQATGEPVRIGMVSDGATDAFDNTDELRAAEATAEYWNTHQGGIAGRPVEVVTCETGADPSGGADCANQLVGDGVAAVALSNSAVAESVWEPLHAAGIPTMWFQTSGSAIMTDAESSFVLVNPLTGLFGLPISVAESEGTDQLAFILIDVPEAREGLDSLGPTILGDAGLEYEAIAVAPGTADMAQQAQQAVNTGAGLVHVTGNDAFCIAAFNGLTAVGYDGAVAAVTQCITDATREAVPPDVLEGTFVTSTMALGATDDPTYQLYEAVMSTYSDVDDVADAIAMGGYVTMASLLTSLEGIEGEIAPETVIETIKSMPEQEMPGGGGMTFQCGGSAIELGPAVCSNQWLETTLDAEGQPTTYEVVDSTDILAVLSE